jgi:RNA polymerase sigma factor (sigma-70 family)
MVIYQQGGFTEFGNKSVELTQKYRYLIENIVKSNIRFSGNEDLFEDFCSETFKRSYLIISSINDIDHIERYLSKVASSAILEVLKSSGRLRRSSSGYVKTNEVPVAVVAPSVVNDVYQTDEDGFILYDIPDPAASIEDSVLSKDEANSIVKAVYELNYNELEKRFLEIFTLRYIENLSQNDISKMMGISQGEVSKRLAELIRKIGELVN